MYLEFGQTELDSDVPDDAKKAYKLARDDYLSERNAWSNTGRTVLLSQRDAWDNTGRTSGTTRVGDTISSNETSRVGHFGSRERATVYVPNTFSRCASSKFKTIRIAVPCRS